MRIVAIHEKAVPVSRFADPAVPSGGLTTSAVAVVSDRKRGGRPLIGFGFGSVGRYAQSGLIRERFIPRLLAARPAALLGDDEVLDPMLAWNAMMAGEKAGGHGERCVAVGALDMALWDLAAKAHDLPLYALWRRRFGDGSASRPVSSTLAAATGIRTTICGACARSPARCLTPATRD